VSTTKHYSVLLVTDSDRAHTTHLMFAIKAATGIIQRNVKAAIDCRAAAAPPPVASAATTMGLTIGAPKALE
jgi:hypothetical protein